MSDKMNETIGALALENTIVPVIHIVNNENSRRTDNEQAPVAYTATTEKDGGEEMCELERQNLKARQKSRIFHEDHTEIPTSSRNCRLFVKNALPSEATLHNAKLVTRMSNGLAFYDKNASADIAESQ